MYPLQVRPSGTGQILIRSFTSFFAAQLMAQLMALPHLSQFQQSCNGFCPVQVLEFIHHDGPPPALPPLNSNFHAKLVEQERGFR